MKKLTTIDVKSRLFDAFREDHAQLGGCLHELSERVQVCDEDGARQLASLLDVKAGAHIAFEQADFYPALAAFLPSSDIDQMYAEHADGFALIMQLQSLSNGELSNALRREALLHEIYAMEQHVSECGELFGAMGGLDDVSLRQLLERLEHWRNRAPYWSDLEVQAAGLST